MTINDSGERRTRSTARRSTRSGSKLNGAASRSTKYTVRQRSIGFGNKNFLSRFEPKELAVMAVMLLAVIVLFILLISAIRGCSSRPATNQTQEVEINALDSRVAAGVSEDLTQQFSASLDRSEKLEKIAQHADQYPESLLRLALTEPTAIDFVAAYPDSNKKEAQAYTDTVDKGSAPMLYTYDMRWGSVDYGGEPLAATGSGPTCLAMARMGLTGAADQTPATIAALAVDKKATNDDSGTNASFFEDIDSSLGLYAEKYEISSDNIAIILSSKAYCLCEVGAGTLTDSSHWVLVVGQDDNGALLVYDPTSYVVSSRPWSYATIAGSTTNMYLLMSDGSQDVADESESESKKTESESKTKTESESSSSESTSTKSN